MGKAFELPKDAKCGECKSKIKEGDLFTIIYEDDDSGKIKHLLCDNCEVDDHIQFYRDTGNVGSKLSVDAALAHYHLKESDLGEDESLSRLRKDVQHFYKKYKKELLEIHAGSEEIQKEITSFEAKHWVPYLKKYWNDTDQRGHAAKVGNIEVLMWGCAGRVMLTVQRDKDSITMIFSDYKESDDLRGGQQGIDAPQKVALEMLKELVKTEKITFKPKKSVTMAGL